MAPSFSNNTEYLKSSVQNGTGIFVTEKQFLQWKPISISWNGVELQVIKEIQISRHIIIYDQN